MTIKKTKKYLTEGSIFTHENKFTKFRGSISTSDTGLVHEVDIKVSPIKGQYVNKRKVNICPICAAFGYKHSVVGKTCSCCGVQLEWEGPVKND